MTLQELKDLADFLPKLEQEIADKERELKGLTDRREQFVRQTLVAAFHDAGVAELSLTDGTKLKLKSFYVGRITEESRNAALDWLRENNHDGIIKNQIIAQFGRGEDALAEEAKKALQELHVLHEHKATIHPATLNAFVNERMDQPDFPAQLFGATLIEQVDIGKKRA